MEVEMKIRGLMMDPSTNMPIVVLKDAQGSAILPIWVGIYEANAIALEIEKVQTPRPMTHDLLKNVLLGLDVRVQKVVVNELREDTFFALIWVERNGEMMSIDSRPSDALALTRTARENSPLPEGLSPPIGNGAVDVCTHGAEVDELCAHASSGIRDILCTYPLRAFELFWGSPQ